ncbi:MAG: dephospho-CoA kinase [Peptoniphilus sp.]|nr:dephospho-CoA kinase [Peptoniphilus sp.]
MIQNNNSTQKSLISDSPSDGVIFHDKKIIALTGSISTGKSTAARIIKDMGFQIIDLDKIGHELYEDREVTEEINRAYGMNFTQRGVFDRKALSKYVFEDKSRLETLNKIVHGKIFAKLIQTIGESQEKIIFVDIPLLIELIEKKNNRLIYDEIWLVYVPMETQIARLIKRDDIQREEALKKISSQMNIESKVKYADVLLNNEKDIPELEEQIHREIKRLRMK